MALDAEHRLAFLACEDNNLMTVFNLQSHKPISSLPMAEGGDVIAYDPGLRRIYVACYSGAVSSSRNRIRNISANLVTCRWKRKSTVSLSTQQLIRFTYRSRKSVEACCQDRDLRLRPKRANPRMPIIKSAPRAICVLLLILAGCGFAHAQGGPPLLTDDPGTAEYKHWEINLAVLPEIRHVSRNFELPLADFNYGANEHTQLKFEIRC